MKELMFTANKKAGLHRSKPAYGGLEGDRLHFLPDRKKIMVRLGPALAGNSPPDCRMENFDPSNEKENHPER